MDHQGKLRIDPDVEADMNDRIKDVNPYTYPAGPELDLIIHRKLFGQESRNEHVPAYSTNVSESSKVRSRLKSNFGHPVIVGQTRMSGRRFFARYDSDPSTATEVLAESEPLALCRLALILIRRTG
jgi:hypothetical protein